MFEDMAGIPPVDVGHIEEVPFRCDEEKVFDYGIGRIQVLSTYKKRCVQSNLIG
jgi:hypothetical protein